MGARGAKRPGIPDRLGCLGGGRRRCPRGEGRLAGIVLHGIQIWLRLDAASAWCRPWQCPRGRRETRHQVRRNRPKSGMPLRARVRKAAWPAAKVAIKRHPSRRNRPKNGMVCVRIGRHAVFRAPRTSPATPCSINRCERFMHLRRGSGGRFKPRFPAANLPLFCPSAVREPPGCRGSAPSSSSRTCVLRTKDDVHSRRTTLRESRSRPATRPAAAFLSDGRRGGVRGV